MPFWLDFFKTLASCFIKVGFQTKIEGVFIEL